MSPSNEIWGPLPLVAGESLQRSLGELQLHVRREADEVWVGTAGDGEILADADWTRWSVATDDSLELKATLPDRPIVVSPELPFFLPPEGAARVFVRIPLFARLVRVDGEGRYSSLGEFPTLVLSDTWWGGFTEGVLAYWMTTQARRTVDPELLEPLLAICPVSLRNGSDQPLPVDRIAIRVSHLTLFGRENAVWTDEVKVHYHGLNESSELRYTGHVPEDAGELDRLCDPREEPTRGLRGKTFGRFRTLSGWG